MTLIHPGGVDTTYPINGVSSGPLTGSTRGSVRDRKIDVPGLCHTIGQHEGNGKEDLWIDSERIDPLEDIHRKWSWFLGIMLGIDEINVFGSLDIPHPSFQFVQHDSISTKMLDTPRRQLFPVLVLHVILLRFEQWCETK